MVQDTANPADMRSSLSDWRNVPAARIPNPLTKRSMSSESASERQRLKARLKRADELRRSGRLEESRAVLDQLTLEPRLAELGQITALGLPRKLVSARLKLAKSTGDAVSRIGLQYHLVPDPERLDPYCRFNSDQRRRMARAQCEQVPRCIHQIWIGDSPVPPACRAWHRHAMAHGFEYRLWREQDLQQIGVAQLPLFRQLVAEGNFPGAVDLARYQILHKIGGIYLDCDWYPARDDQSLADRLPMLGLTVMAEPIPRSTGVDSLLLSNAMIASPPEHPVLERLLDILADVVELLPDAPVWWSTGPLIFTRVCRQGPLSLCDAGLVAGDLPQQTTEQQVLDWCRRSQAADGGLLLSWKSWIWTGNL